MFNDSAISAGGAVYKDTRRTQCCSYTCFLALKLGVSCFMISATSFDS